MKEHTPGEHKPPEKPKPPHGPKKLRITFHDVREPHTVAVLFKRNKPKE